MKTNEEIKKTLDLDTFKDEWGHSVIPRDIVDEAITTLTAKHEADIEKARKEERGRIEAVFKEHVPPHAMDLEDSVWLKRLLNKAFGHDKKDN